MSGMLPTLEMRLMLHRARRSRKKSLEAKLKLHTSFD